MPGNEFGRHRVPPARPARQRAHGAALLLALAACGPSIEAPYLINSMRVVAVLAEPPEVLLGQASAITAIVAVPPRAAPQPAVALSVCREHDGSGAATDCPDPIALTALAPVALTAHVLAVTALYTPDATTLAGVPASTLAAGFWVPLRAAASAAGVPTVRAVKRVVVSSGSAPANLNPVLRKVDIWSGDAVSSVPYAVHRDLPVTLIPDYDPTDFAAYEVLAADGSRAARLEAPQITWYVSVGTLSSGLTQGERSVVWSLPGDADLLDTTQELVAVLRDGRGGTAAWAADVQIVP